MEKHALSVWDKQYVRYIKDDMNPKKIKVESLSLRWKQNCTFRCHVIFVFQGCIGINTCLDPGKHIKRILIPYKENHTSMGHGPWVIECPGKTCVLYGLFLVSGTPIHNLSNGIFEVQLLKPAPHKTVSKRNLKNNNSLLKLTLFTNIMVLVPCYFFLEGVQLVSDVA